MIPRRLYEHVNAHNWFAVLIDLVIVVVGVFLGIQVSNWNETRQLSAREEALLGELRREVERTNALTEQRANFYALVFESGKKSLAFLEGGAQCGENCWPVVVDFFHASQWTRVDFKSATFDEMRRLGLPRSRELITALEAYYDQNEGLAVAFADKPAYRELVRGLLPVAVQEAYWGVCHRLVDGIEEFTATCPQAVANDVSAAVVARIAAHPDIPRLLTNWTGFVDAAASFDQQVRAGEKVLAIIDAELEGRRQ